MSPPKLIMNKNKENMNETGILSKIDLTELEAMDPSLGKLKRRWFPPNISN